MIEMALGVLVNHLVIADGCECHRIPVHHAHSPVNHALLVEMAESRYHRVGEFRLHREPGPVPVAGCAQLAELLEYYASVLLLPLPGIFEELLPADILLAYAPFLEPCHNLALGGYGRVVRTRHPAGVLAVHPGLPDEHVVEGVVQDMAHMEYAGDIRRRYYYGIWFPFIRFGMEILVF